MLTADFVSLGIVILLVLMGKLPKKMLYILNGAILIFFGLVPLLNQRGIMNLDLYSYPISNYTIFFVVIVAGRELFKEGIEEKPGPLQLLSIILGLAIIIITALPTLSKFGAISFQPPEYARVIDFVIYTITGILLIIGIGSVNTR